MQIHQRLSAFDSPHIQQALDDLVEPVAVFAGCREKLPLAWSERADLLFGKQMKNHPH